MKKLFKKFNNLLLLIYFLKPSVCFAAEINIPSTVVKFSTAMLGVLISSLAIFIGLKLYKKLIIKNPLKSDNIDYKKNLETPKDFKEAINLFLSKTDK